MSSCHDLNLDREDLEGKDIILLMGNPNVGKSVFFSRMTGIHVVSSNFAGTTVTYTEGKLQLDDHEYTLVDVPGTYSMNPTSEAEAVATSFMSCGAKAVVCVLDASNLRRNLKLALEIKEFGIPVVFTLNLTDVARRHGLMIDEKLLSEELSAPVIPTVAVKGDGLDEVLEALKTILYKTNSEITSESENKSVEEDIGQIEEAASDQHLQDKDFWKQSKIITDKVVRKTSNGERLNRLDKLGEKMMKPWPGMPIALLVILFSLGIIVGGGKALRSVALLPLVNQVIVPFFRSVFTSILPEGMILNILIGEYGIFVISFEWILALILPYVFLFYVVFSFLEDSGYLPRVSILFDNVMRKIGIQGGSLITLSMGLGCAVPAIIGTRNATTHKERLIVTTMVCFAVPCISQTGALISLLGSHSWWLLLLMLMLGLFILVTTALVTGKILKGKVDPLIIEVPNLLIPERKSYGKKLWIRMKHFLYEAELPMMFSILIAAIFKESGILDWLAVHLEPFMSGWLGMPKEAVIGLVLGIVRREMAAAPLLALDLTGLQIFVGATVALLYLPCLSVFGVLAKEFKARTAVTISLATTLTAFLIGGLINQVGQLFIH